MSRLAGKRILITGSTGIAAAGAERAAAEGATLFIVSRTGEHARDLAARHPGTGWAAADLTDEAQVDAAVEAATAHLGRIDGLLSVAGGSGRRFGDGPLHELTAEGWDRTLELNLRSQALVARAVTRAMLAGGGADTGGGSDTGGGADAVGGGDGRDECRGDEGAGGGGLGGSIVLVSSVLATRPVPELFATHAYATAKGALHSLALTTAAYYAPHGIRVNVVAPALTATPMSRRAADDPATVAFARRKQPLVGGFLAPDDVAHAAIYLLSGEARAVTGQILTIDGGWSLTATPASTETSATGPAPDTTPATTAPPAPGPEP